MSKLEKSFVAYSNSLNFRVIKEHHSDRSFLLVPCVLTEYILGHIHTQEIKHAVKEVPAGTEVFNDKYQDFLELKYCYKLALGALRIIMV